VLRVVGSGNAAQLVKPQYPLSARFVVHVRCDLEQAHAIFEATNGTQLRRRAVLFLAFGRRLSEGLGTGKSFQGEAWGVSATPVTRHSDRALAGPPVQQPTPSVA